MMKRSAFRRGLLLAAMSVSFAFSAHAAEKVTLQLKWLPQSQFAGYYVAQEKGFYKQEGLDVTILLHGPHITPL